jgi:transposase-like protein
MVTQRRVKRSQKFSTPLARVQAEKLVRDIRRATRKHHSAEDKIRIVLEGLRGEESIAALYRRQAIAESLYCSWSKEFPGEALALHGFKCPSSDELRPLWTLSNGVSGPSGFKVRLPFGEASSDGGSSEYRRQASAYAERIGLRLWQRANWSQMI